MTEIKRKPMISTTGSLETDQSIDSHQQQASLSISFIEEESDEEEGSRGNSSKQKGSKGGNTSSGNGNGSG